MIQVTLCIGDHNIVVYIWQNRCVFTQKRYFKVVLGSNDKQNLTIGKPRILSLSQTRVINSINISTHVRSSVYYRTSNMA